MASPQGRTSTRQPPALSTRILAAWFVVGLAAGLFLQLLQVRALGGDWTALISAGEASRLLPLIEEELGPVQVVEGAGHDGQFSYLIARDPLGDGAAPEAFDHGAYRYRRILYPLFGSGFGLLGPEATLWGLVAWAVIGMGLATSGVVALATHLGGRSWAAAGVLANPGVWLSVQLLTPDVLALGLSVTGVTLWVRGQRSWAMVLLAAAALTKDQYLLVALAVAAYSWTQRARQHGVLLAVSAGLPLLVWSAWLTVSMGEGLTPRGNLSLPFVGVVGAADGWAASGAKDLTFSLIAILGLAAAVVVPWWRRNRLVRWLSWSWAALAVSSSGWVWNLGNNSLRVFAPLLVFAVLAASLPANDGGRADV